MPIIDLRDPQEPSKLKEFARFLVFAFMLHPEDRIARERLMAKIAKENEAHARRAELSHEEADKELRLFGNYGSQAGFIALTQIQLHQSGMRPSQNNSIKIIQHAQPDWLSQGNTIGWQAPKPHEYLPGARQTILKNIKSFRSVQFLWAAFLHVEQNNGGNAFWAEQIESIFVFLGHAEAFAELYSKLPYQGQGPRPKNVFKERRRFKIHKDLVIRPKLKVKPLPDEWRRAIEQ